MFDACYRCSSLPGQIIRWEMWNGASAHAIRGMKSSKARLRICLSGGKCIREVKMTECFLYLKQVFYFSTGSRGQLYSRVLPKVVVAIMGSEERKRRGEGGILEGPLLLLLPLLVRSSSSPFLSLTPIQVIVGRRRR